jgi:hypothetical protein
MAVDPEVRPAFDIPDGDAALYALAEWHAEHAPKLRHQVQQLRDVMIAVGELPSPTTPPLPGDALSAEG